MLKRFTVWIFLFAGLVTFVFRGGRKSERLQG